RRGGHEPLMLRAVASHDDRLIVADAAFVGHAVKRRNQITPPPRCIDALSFSLVNTTLDPVGEVNLFPTPLGDLLHSHPELLDQRRTDNLKFSRRILRLCEPYRRNQKQRNKHTKK